MNKNKEFFKIIFIFVILTALAIGQSGPAGISKDIRSNALHNKIVDSGDEGEGAWGWAVGPWRPYHGFGEVSLYSSHAYFFGVSSYEDTTGTINKPGITGCAQWETDYNHNIFPVQDEQGLTIHRYYETTPPVSYTDGLRNSMLFPVDNADHVDAAKIPGNADEMIESRVTNNLGVTIHQRVYAFKQRNHDDYIIYDWIIKNTGDMDYDPEIELTQTLDSLFFLRQHRYQDEGIYRFPHSFGQKTTDSYGQNYDLGGRNFFMQYGRLSQAAWGEVGSTWDNFGATESANFGMPGDPYYMGEAILFASKNVNDMTTNDLKQPRTSFVDNCDLEYVTQAPGPNYSNSMKNELYKIMKQGNKWLHPDSKFVREMSGGNVEPGNHNEYFDEVLTEEFAYVPGAESWDLGWFAPSPIYIIGPYTLEPGDSIRIVRAKVAGNLSSKKGYEIGNKWFNNELTKADLPPGVEWNDEYDLPQNLIDKHPAFTAPNAENLLYHPEGDTMNKVNNLVKDSWLVTGEDSLFNNAYAALWAFENDYKVPEAPPAPSLEVTSGGDRIVIEWGDRSEQAPDFAGYRVYRMLGNPYPDIRPNISQEMLGREELIFECGEGTENALTHRYEDKSAVRGEDYYYFVTAFDNGDNMIDYDGEQHVLESSRYLNRTREPASLKRAPESSLDSIKIVPNPWNIGAQDLQFSGSPYKVMFYNLPPKCKIRIYTESLDLVRTINHDDGTGDETWGANEQQRLTTDERQRLASGIYIVHFELTEDITNDEGNIIQNKGDSVIKKLIVIR